MQARAFISNRRGQGTVENLMLTAILSAVLIPIVYKTVIVPLMNVMKEQRKGLVTLVSQDNKKTVPSAWFASERIAQFKDPKNIEQPKDIKTDDIPEPGEVPPPKDINNPQNISTKPIKTKDIPPTKKINPPGDIRPGSGSSGAGGSGSALGSGTQDPDFFGGGGEGKSKSGDSIDGAGPGDGSVGKGSVSGGGADEYSPKGKTGVGEANKSQGKTESGKKDETGPEKRAKQNLVLNETRDEERSRSSPFDWWLLIKLLILGLIIFLIILIGLSNMKKR